MDENLLPTIAIGGVILLLVVGALSFFGGGSNNSKEQSSSNKSSTKTKKKNKKKKASTGQSEKATVTKEIKEAKEEAAKDKSEESNSSKTKKSKSKKNKGGKKESEKEVEKEEKIEPELPKVESKPRKPVDDFDEEEWEVVGKPDKPQKPKEAKKAEIKTDGKDSSSTKITVTVEKNQIGVLIGVNGVTIKKLQDVTGAKINLPPNSAESYGPVKITVEGPVDGVRECAEAIKDLTTKGMCKITHGNFVEGTCQVHPDYIPLIIGMKGKGLKGGETIRGLQDNTGTNIVMPVSTPGAKKMLYVKILGSKTGVDRCKSAIKELMKYYHTDVVHKGITHLELDIPEGQHHVIIGKRGNTIRGIEGNTGAKINIPRPSSINPNVVITGTPSAIANAKKQIDNALIKSQQRDDDGYGYDANYDDYDDDDGFPGDDDYDYSQHTRR